MKQQAEGHRPSDRSNRWIRYGLIGLLVLFVVVAVVLFLVEQSLDSDALKARIANAVTQATDSLYQIEIDTLDLDLFPGTFYAEGVHLYPDSSELAQRRAAGLLPHARVELMLPHVRVTGIDLWDLLQKQPQAGTVSVVEPHVHVVLDTTRQNDTRATERSLHARLGERLAGVQLDLFEIQDATLSLERLGTEVQYDTLRGITLRLHEISIDSASAPNPNRFLFSDDVELHIDPQRRYLRDSLYAFYVGDVTASSREAVLALDSLHLAPTVSDAAFVARHRYTKARYITSSSGITAHGVDFRSLLEQQAIHLQTLTVDSLLLDVYESAKKPQRPGSRTMPAEAFRKIERPLSLDTLYVNGGRLCYSQLAEDGARPGTICFGDVHGTITNVTNDTTEMSHETPALVEASALVAGAERLHTTITLPLLAQDLDFSARGQLSSMPAAALNTILVNHQGARIESGWIDTLWFDMTIRAGVASGTVHARYHDLEMETLDKVTKERGLRKRLSTFVLNTFMLKADNPPVPGAPLRVGTVDHTLERRATFFKFLWHALRSGLYDLTGL